LQQDISGKYFDDFSAGWKDPETSSGRQLKKEMKRGD
jgi:hypothetical protein